MISRAGLGLRSPNSSLTDARRNSKLFTSRSFETHGFEMWLRWLTAKDKEHFAFVCSALTAADVPSRENGRFQSLMRRIFSLILVPNQTTSRMDCLYA